MFETVDGWDAIHANLSGVGDGQGAGYTTGSPDIRWTNADWHAHAGAVRICQDAGATDDTADVLDIERYAATPEDAPGWYDRALESFHAGRRPGQRHPAVYCNPSTLPRVSAAFRKAGSKVLPWLFEALWGIGLGGARAMIDVDYAGFLMIGVQYASHYRFDSDVWSRRWLDDVSRETSGTPPPAGEGWTARMLEELPTLKQGDKGKAVRTAQGLLVARYYHLGTTGRRGDGIDGDFGPLTDAAVRDAQGKSGVAEDGIIGPKTWPLLAGV